MPQSVYDTLPPLSAQLQAVIQEGWEQEVLSQLPADYEQQARQSGAFVRARALTSVADLLRGVLAYVLCAPSFRHLGAWAVLIGLANLSHVAWHKRLQKARPFLLWLLSELLAVPALPSQVPAQRIGLCWWMPPDSKNPGALETTGVSIWATTCWPVGCWMSKSAISTPPRASRSLAGRQVTSSWRTAATVVVANWPSSWGAEPSWSCVWPPPRCLCSLEKASPLTCWPGLKLWAVGKPVARWPLSTK